MNDNVKKPPHVARQGVDHLPGQLDLIEHAKTGAPHPLDVPEETPENVVKLDTPTRYDRKPAEILKSAYDEGLTDVIVIGFDKDGQEYFAASNSDGAEAVWLLERTKLKLLRLVES